ncbi:unnamed protein product, partial [Allacma fusca]
MTVLVYIEDSMIQKNQNKPCWIGGLRKQATGKNEQTRHIAPCTSVGEALTQALYQPRWSLLVKVQSESDSLAVLLKFFKSPGLYFKIYHPCFKIR